MKLVSFALLYLGSAAFFGLEAAKLDIASDFKRKWATWALSRARRDAKFPAATLITGQAADANVPSLIRTQDVKGEPGMAQPSRPEDAHIRVKRYHPNARGFVHSVNLRIGCRLGTCTVQNLAHQIYHLTDKDKDDSAPASKIGAQGYGRRRRSLSDTLAAAASAALERRSSSSSGRSTRTLSRLLRSGASWGPAAQPWHAPPHSSPFRRR
ncbi:pro-adrenomedullin [Hemicordylus capensis]|uniref:pro-adrenomedullin n=1 Tax=Hemicordylus capensis TaxID=884348 RepID=UPI0023048016|nr:pro-adrenomedullin [Hemicordylus capensis]